MSIWSSAPGGPGAVVNLHDADTDQYAATGRARIVVDIATATGWNDRIRLSLFEESGEPLDVCLAMDRDDARALRDQLTAVLDRAPVD